MILRQKRLILRGKKIRIKRAVPEILKKPSLINIPAIREEYYSTECFKSSSSLITPNENFWSRKPRSSPCDIMNYNSPHVISLELQEYKKESLINNPSDYFSSDMRKIDESARISLRKNSNKSKLSFISKFVLEAKTPADLQHGRQQIDPFQEPFQELTRSVINRSRSANVPLNPIKLAHRCRSTSILTQPRDVLGSIT